MTIKELSEFWGISLSTLYSRKKKNPEEFKAFELGTLCLKHGIKDFHIKKLIEDSNKENER